MGVDAVRMIRRRAKPKADRRKIRALEMELFPEWYPTHAEYYGTFNGPPPGRMVERNGRWYALTDRPGLIIPYHLD